MLSADSYARRTRLGLVLVAIILVAQSLNTLLLWRATGRVPLWSLFATLGVALLAGSMYARRRRLAAAAKPPETSARRKRRRLRDPHRR